VNTLEFANPENIHWLWLVLLIGGFAFWADGRAQRALWKFVGSRLAGRLTRGPSVSRRRSRIVFVSLAGVALVTALMRPQYGYTTVVTPRAGAEIMIALDISRSMLAEDVAPNRLERAKAEIRDLLEYLDGDQVGLIGFAGRATVLAPLTPDFRYVNLSLDEAKFGLTGRGGTRLEEPIRKAVQGFGASGNVSRSVLLITDGEDHDSFPLEAAKAAAERGVRILAIGFGDEDGASILVTDPKTGARTELRDDDGQLVRSRLDGDLLRELATITGGAYVPAGTGVLDLESIYAEHIAPLTRGTLDGRERRIPNEMFQWPVLTAVVLLTLGVLTTATAPIALAGFALVLTLGSFAPRETVAAAATNSTAQAQNKTIPTGSKNTAADAVEPADAKPEAEPLVPLPESPREAYNLGLAKLTSGDLEAAGKLFVHARDIAENDADSRFQATFNRAWVSIRQAANHREAEDLSKALDALYEASRWFGDAVKLRPEHEHARINLELTLRQALQLADQLRGDESSIEKQLDALIKNQRASMAELAGAIESIAHGDAHRSTRARVRLRDLAIRSLITVSEAQGVLEAANDTARAIDKDSTDAEQRLRKRALETAIGHLHTALGRVGQGRARLRRGEGVGAYRRSAHALGSMRSARDQLRDPVSQLDSLLQSGRELLQLGALHIRAAETRPDWLSDGFLNDASHTLLERTQALSEQLKEGAAAPQAEPAPAANTAPGKEGKQALSPAKMAAALPYFESAINAFTVANQARQTGNALDGLRAESKGVDQLAVAREVFAELRELIERAHASEQRVVTLNSKTEPDEDPAQVLELVTHLHQSNIERMVRVGEELSAGMTKKADTGGAAEQGGANPEAERMERGYNLWVTAQNAMHEATRALVVASSERDRTHAAPALEAAVLAIEELRRLFFDLLQHLKEAAAQQADVNHATTQISVLAKSNGIKTQKTQLGTTGIRQDGLGKRAGELAQELKDQAKAAAAQAAPAAAGNAGAPAAAGPTPEALTQAGELVAGAAEKMSLAAQEFSQEAPQFDALGEGQEEALKGLNEAIALLQPPQDDQGDEQQDKQEQGENEDGKDQEGKDDPQSTENLSQLLQGVRDREAKRRKDRARGAATPSAVEKDW
jgi:Ca-activated chloride channel homolog